MESLLLSMCDLQGLCGFAIPWEPVPHARLVLTPMDAKDCRDFENALGFLATQEGPKAMELFFLEILYQFQPPNLS